MTEFASYPSLTGRRAFVTGGATGIGAAITRNLCHQGTAVCFLDIDHENGEALAEETGAQFAHVDVTDITALQDAIGDFGAVDILVNNVANDTRHDWRTLTSDDWDARFAVNLRPSFFAIQSVADGMIARGHGSIINIGSISWKVKHAAMPAYTTAKSAAHGLTRSFVRILGPAGVRVNTVMPGWVMTERQKTEHFDHEGAKQLAAAQPLRGLIAPEDAAALVAFLAADDSAMCTGQEFTIDGGWT
ncbi:SDR family NAD(P)-dependent oxidoreductase [Pelagimonas varians]|uniref:3-alpha-(Or 20-beta)-hydroxysteroid dehydrogenase n=1 Tax=Pelagimonas varians TaxID=696760 RepID=A0A238L0T3_9RHOB|nr:SDR family oxidoreductase [Pelagimonas varians]PYG27222.1 NAD(P)-dependent dehydrogenase (short-subunit alcohol dehydrogenase family) [Pelagimonas varians]SMX48695.1 3-alpha-(or 20-beta)-hydroxysteroid dehydrogenase [Pelagimonas varians]